MFEHILHPYKRNCPADLVVLPLACLLKLAVI